jgi:hypothetical protein
MPTEKALDPFYQLHGALSWKHEKVNPNLGSDFMNFLPKV